MEWSTYDMQQVLLIFQRVLEDYKTKKNCPYCHTYNENLLDGHADGCFFKEWLVNNPEEIK